MAQNLIRWKQGDYISLGRAVSDFNKKKKELETEENKNYLPETQNYRELKNSIKTRQELNNVIRSLRRFTSRENATDIVENAAGQKMTRWEKNENRIRSSIAIRNLNRDLKELTEKPITKQGFTRREMRKY